MFKKYTGWQWLLIDAANQFGLDKELFEDRIQWGTENLQLLDSQAFMDEAETKPLYAKAVMAIRRAQRGEPMGHMVGVDAICSGIQIMSCMTGCVAGATNTGLILQDVRSDAYKACNDEMGTILGGKVDVTRKQAKDALMTLELGVTV